MNQVSPRKAIIVVLLLQVLSVFINSSTLIARPLQATEPEYWPTEDWLTSSPEMQGMDSRRLLELEQYIMDQNFPLDSLLVVRHGYIVYEIYPRNYSVGDRHFLYSVTKSFTSALVGIAIGQGFIANVNTPVLSIFSDRTIPHLNPYWEALTVEHLLNMMAGFEWNEDNPPYPDPQNLYVQMMNAPDSIQFILDLQMILVPGTTFEYSSGASHLLAGIVYETTGEFPLAFANEHLFEPLGIDDVQWGTDPQGINFGAHDLFLRPRDMAKFGFLYLHDGVWDGLQIIPELWVTQSKQSVVTLGEHHGYGYQWWKDPLLDTLESRGAYNQWIIVHEELDMVIVFTASDMQRPSPPGVINPKGLMTDYIFPAILSPVSPIGIALIAGVIIGVPIIAISVYLLRKRRIRARGSLKN